MTVPMGVPVVGSRNPLISAADQYWEAVGSQLTLLRRWTTENPHAGFARQARAAHGFDVRLERPVAYVDSQNHSRAFILSEPIPDCSWSKTALVALSLLTVVIPLIMGCLKLILRSSHTFNVIDAQAELAKFNGQDFNYLLTKIKRNFDQLNNGKDAEGVTPDNGSFFYNVLNV